MAWFGESKRGRIAAFLGNDPTLVGYWQFGSQWSGLQDNSGNGYVLTNSNGVGFSQGRFGLSADSGSANTNEALYVANTTLGAIANGSFSVSCWMYLKSLSGTQEPWFLNGINISSPYIATGLQLTSSTITFFRTHNGVSETDDAVSWTPTVNTWYHVVATYDGSYLRLYLNGVLIGSPVADSTVGNSGGTDVRGMFLFSPNASYGGSNWFSGKLDDVAVLSRAMSAPQIAQYYAWATKKRPGICAKIGNTFATYFKTLTVAGSGVASIAYGRVVLKALSTSATGVAALVKQFVYGRTLSVSAVASASLSQFRQFFRSLAVSATGSPSLSKAKLFLRTMATTAISSVSLAKAMTYAKTLTSSAQGLVKMLINGVSSIYTNKYPRKGTNSYVKKY